MADIKVDLRGLDELQKKLKLLPAKLKGKPISFALRKSATVISKAAQHFASEIDDPETSEKIQANIAVRSSPKFHKATGDYKMRVGVLGGGRASGGLKKNARIALSRRSSVYTDKIESEPSIRESANPGGDTWYWRLLEFGTEKMQAQPFLIPAAKLTGEAALDTFEAELERAIDRAIKRLGSTK